MWLTAATSDGFTPAALALLESRTHLNTLALHGLYSMLPAQLAVSVLARCEDAMLMNNTQMSMPLHPAIAVTNSFNGYSRGGAAVEDTGMEVTADQQRHHYGVLQDTGVAGWALEGVNDTPGLTGSRLGTSTPDADYTSPYATDSETASSGYRDTRSITDDTLLVPAIQMGVNMVHTTHGNEQEDLRGDDAEHSHYSNDVPVPQVGRFQRFSEDCALAGPQIPVYTRLAHAGSGIVRSPRRASFSGSSSNSPGSRASSLWSSRSGISIGSSSSNVSSSILVATRSGFSMGGSFSSGRASLRTTRSGISTSGTSSTRTSRSPRTSRESVVGSSGSRFLISTFGGLDRLVEVTGSGECSTPTTPDDAAKLGHFREPVETVPSSTLHCMIVALCWPLIGLLLLSVVCAVVISQWPGLYSSGALHAVIAGMIAMAAIGASPNRVLSRLSPMAHLPGSWSHVTSLVFSNAALEQSFIQVSFDLAPASKGEWVDAVML